LLLHDVIFGLSASLSALLKKEIGCSSPSTFSAIKQLATVSKEEKEKIKNIWNNQD
jgi:hypothetical protein